MINGPGALRGWGQYPLPDYTLLRVRGFDPAVRALRYEVNEAFGRFGSVRGPRLPFMVVVQVRVPISADPARQVLGALVAAARSAVRSATETRKYLADRFPNVPSRVLAIAPTVALTDQQSRSLGLLADSIATPLDSLLSDLALAISGKANPRPDSLARMALAANALVNRGRDGTRRILVPAQWERLPEALRNSTGRVPIEQPTRVTLPTP